MKANGLPGFYSPDFLVRTATNCLLVETKAQNQLGQPDVVRKKTAAAAWCARLNELTPEARGGLSWHYCLLGESVFYEFTQKGATMEEILKFSCIRPAARAAGMLF
jgi:type III restriction enzyme